MITLGKYYMLLFTSTFFMWIGIFLLNAHPLHSANNVPKGSKIKWLTFEEAVKLNKKNPKKILVDVYTSWCGWCKEMDKKTFANPKIADYVNKHYYPVKFDAEQKEDILYNGKVYKYEPKFKSHEIALSLLSGKMSYPTTVFLDETVSILSVVPGYLDPPTFEKIIVYYKDNHHLKTDWPKFEKSYKTKMK